MGNSSSSSSRPHNDETVDFGYLTPQGVYTGPRDWNHAIVTQLICSRRLAPFYRPLEDYDDSWTDDQILAARRNPPEVEQSSDSTRAEASQALPASASSKSHTKRPSTLKDPAKPEAAIYRGAVECPICFLVGLAPHLFLCFNLAHYVTRIAVLSPKYQPFQMLRPSNMYRMFCPNQT